MLAAELNASVCVQKMDGIVGIGDVSHNLTLEQAVH
jgi:hypothetical protein